LIKDKVIEKLNNPNKDVLFLDIGANIGIFGKINFKKIKII
jgi:hypothetical protein